MRERKQTRKATLLVPGTKTHTFRRVPELASVVVRYSRAEDGRRCPAPQQKRLHRQKLPAPTIDAMAGILFLVSLFFLELVLLVVLN